MKKFVKIVSIVFVSLIVLILLAAVIVPRVVDMNKFKPQITAIVQSQTGRELTIDGDIKLRILPRLRVDLNEVTFANAEGYTPEHMAKVGRVSLGVAIFPLLKKEIDVSRIILEDTEIHYAINKDGKSNIDDIIALQQAKAVEEPEDINEEEPDATDAPGFDFSNASVSLLRINNMALSYSDARTGVEYQLNNARLEAEDVAIGRPVDLELSADFVEVNSKMAAALDLAATVAFAAPEISANITKLAMSYSMPQQGLDLRATMTALAKYDMDTQLANLSDIVLALQASMKGDLTFDGSIRTEIAATSFDLSNLYLDLPDLKLSGDYTTSLIKGKQNIAANTALSFDMAKEALNLKSFNLKTAGVSVDANMSGTKVLSAPNIKGSVSIAEFNLRNLLSALNIDYTPADAAALSKVRLGTSFSFAANVLKAPLKLTLDDSTINIDATVDLSKKKPVITANTVMDALVLDKYLPEAAEEAAPAQAATAAAEQSGPVKIEFPDIQLDLSTLPDVTASLKADKLVITGQELSSISAKLTLINGIMTANLSTNNFCGGRLNADARVTGQKNKFDAAANLNLTGLDLHKLISEYDPEADLSIVPKRGIVDISASVANKIVNVSKLSVAADEYTLTGNVKADFNPADKPMVTFKLDMSKVDLLKLFPKSGGATATAEEVQEKADAATNAPDLNDIPVNAEGTVTVKTLVYDNITVSALSATMKAINGKVELSPLSGNVWGGSFIVNGAVSSKDGKLPASLKLNTSNIKVANIINSFKPDKKALSGDLTLNADFTVGGLTLSDIRTSINGRGEYSFKNGVVHGIGYNPNLLSLDTIRSFSLLSSEKQTAINDSKGSIVFENGRLTFNQLDLKSQYLNGNIKGGFMLADLSMNFDGILNVESVEVPITLRGSLREPKVAIEQDKLISGLILQYTKKTTTGVITAPVTVPMDIIEGVGKGLEKLFK